MTMRPVILLTDFGLDGDFAGVCHGVIVQRAPGTDVVHLTHGITPQHVLEGALVLRNTLRYMPAGVHMAVVDPGVGTERRGVAVETVDGRIFVGPDNGLLAPAIEMAGGATRAVSLENDDLRVHPVSRTFHGRDIFAPAAAHLAGGGALDDLGPAVEIDSLEPLTIPQAVRNGDEVEAQVWHVDRFGNVALLLGEETLREAIGSVSTVEIEVKGNRFYAALAGTFASVRTGEILLYVDSHGSMSIAVNRGDAADMFRAKAGDTIVIRPANL